MAEWIFNNQVEMHTCILDFSFLEVHGGIFPSLSDSELEGSL